MNDFDKLECLAEWAVNNEVLISATLSVCFTYLETVCVVTILFMVTDNGVFGFSNFFCRYYVFNDCAYWAN